MIAARSVSPDRGRGAGRGVMSGLVSTLIVMGISGCQATAPWWERETRLDPRGVLDLRAKSWWPRANRLIEGQQFLVTSQEPGGGSMLIRRERMTGRRANQVAIVWILDDDGDMVCTPRVKPGVMLGLRAPACDRDSDCYVVDYDADGLVDRMVDYLDNDGDGRPDEMDIRYFVQGELRRSWFWEDRDRDGVQWDLLNYEYSADCFASDPYGDNMLYMNRYDPERRCWWPISECPFAFYDTDGDGQSEAVVRFSAAPMTFDPQKDADYANSEACYQGPFYPELREVGLVNIRYGIDLDNVSSAATPLHYDMGFNLIGKVPYRFAGMRRTNPLRRSPKTTICARHADCRRISETYPADQTGFSWREYEDGTIAIGDRGRAEQDQRWEGVFWTWSRREMHNTGGPTQRWNMRREFCPTPTRRRELYYSEVDRRIHLTGATEGWLEIGCLGDKKPYGEVRMYDTDRDGYFDRWEVYATDDAAPVRVTTTAGRRGRPLPADWKDLEVFYTTKVLPEAIAANEKLIAAMARVQPCEPPAALRRALADSACAADRRYVLDVIREMRYVSMRRTLLEQAKEALDPVAGGDFRAKRDLLAASERAWAMTRMLAEMDQAYGEGCYDRVIDMLQDITAIPRGTP